MSNDMKQKQKLFKRNTQLIAAGLAVLVLGTAVFLSTDTGRDLLGIEFNPFASLAGGSKFRKHDPAKAIPEQYIVVLKDDADSDAAAADLTGRFGGQSHHIYHEALKGFSTKMTEAQAIALSEDPNVAYVEQDTKVETNESQSSPGWALDRVDQRTDPLDLTYNYTATGRGVNIYIIDTGIWTANPEFGGRAFEATATSSGSYNSSTCNGHGTGVAGVAGGATVGLARQAKLYSVRVFPCTGGADLSDVIQGVDWVTSHAIKPAVANLSLGGDALYSALNDAVSQSIRQGIVYTAGAGNSSLDSCRTSPQGAAGIINVGASISTDNPAAWSNYGSCLSFYAPGEGVRTLWNGIDSSGNPNTYTYASGTSFSGPFGAGAAALYLETHPTASPAEVKDALIQNTTTGVINNLPSTSPNRLLYTQLGSVPPPPPPTGGSDTTPPTITSNPAGSTTIKKGQLKFSAKASDSSGISTIVITLDGATLKTCYDISTCTLNIAANSLAVGAHTLTTTATDKAPTPNTATTSITVTR
jgi:subtilisin family serine protease